MGKILMSIKPCYVDKILSGTKKYEYRKIKAKKNNIDKMIIYSTYPVKSIVGEAEIEEIIESTPEQIWNLTQKYSGITKELYFKYYHDKTNAIAYKLGKIIKYDKPKNLSEIGINYSPQSFIYLD